MATADEARYYEHKFTQDPVWSDARPNADEQARWEALRELLAALPAGGRILDVGCGRGWLTHLASRYGKATGIEPVEAVARHAARLYPELHFSSAPLPEFSACSADIVLCSEVIEHVPRAVQSAFISSLARLLKPGGHLLLTTPRAEMFTRWRWWRNTVLPARYRAEPDQPTEELLTEGEVAALLHGAGLRVERRRRAYVRYRALSPANAVLGVRAVERILNLPAFHALRAFCHRRWAVYQVWQARKPG
ncbi:MAG: class I SAM-dependent methyltransferase [Bryobacterales bacterium]|nr:class I SAM-dependent methyltransferase [Bryobacterales bacterium]